jgi:uracil-DNA glycosylase
MSKLKKIFGEGWYELLKRYLESNAFNDLGKYINDRRNSFNVKVYPSKEDIFECFKLCPLEQLKVVIIGKEPYCKNDCSNGLAYAYNGSGPVPRALINISKVFEKDICNGLDLLFEYSMYSWAREGILLYNLSLTVEDSKPGSHKEKWKDFTSNLFNQLSDNKDNIVYLCLGEESKEYIEIIKRNKTNRIIYCPSPEDNKFLLTNPFSRINSELVQLFASNPYAENYEIKWR